MIRVQLNGERQSRRLSRSKRLMSTYAKFISYKGELISYIYTT